MSNVIPLHRPTVRLSVSIAVPSPHPRPSSARPRRNGRSSSSRPAVLTEPVRVSFDDVGGVHVATCARCTETQSAYPDALGWLLDWADTHTCDAELAALLDAVCRPGAA